MKTMRTTIDIEDVRVRAYALVDSALATAANQNTWGTAEIAKSLKKYLTDYAYVMFDTYRASGSADDEENDENLLSAVDTEEYSDERT